jgi:glucose-1-phosphate adenylyltransferase
MRCVSISQLSKDEVVILSGDHLYRMDYRLFVERHRETNADITLSVVPIGEKNASEFGLMKVDATGRVVEFSEKPKGDALTHMRVDTTKLGLNAEQAAEKPYIASMGIYVFKKQVLIDLLKKSLEQTDFGKEIIPGASATHNIHLVSTTSTRRFTRDRAISHRQSCWMLKLPNR